MGRCHCCVRMDSAAPQVSCKYHLQRKFFVTLPFLEGPFESFLNFLLMFWRSKASFYCEALKRKQWHELLLKSCAWLFFRLTGRWRESACECAVGCQRVTRLCLSMSCSSDVDISSCKISWASQMCCVFVVGLNSGWRSCGYRVLAPQLGIEGRDKKNLALVKSCNGMCHINQVRLMWHIPHINHQVRCKSESRGLNNQ